MGFMAEQLKRVLKAGDVVFKDGAAGQSMFIILQGSIEISKILGDQKTVIAELGPGSIFGEMAVIDRHARSATATALTDATLVEISRELFIKKLGETPKWLQAFFAIIVERLRKATEHQSPLLSQGAGRQIAYLVSLLATREEPDSTQRIILPWKKTVATLSFILAINEEQANEVINAMVSAHLGKSENRENIGRVFVVESMEQLNNFAEYCRERSLLEGGHIKMLSDQFSFSDRSELQEQGVMDDITTSALEKKLQERHNQPIGSYKHVIEQYDKEGILVSFNPEGEAPGFRIDKEKFKEKQEKAQFLEEFEQLEKSIMTRD
jgi:CRP/FNR family cyclic AMP-dependent transcriptional regulator